jgi:hypothetical protein
MINIFRDNTFVKEVAATIAAADTFALLTDVVIVVFSTI